MKQRGHHMGRQTQAASAGWLRTFGAGFLLGAACFTAQGAEQPRLSLVREPTGLALSWVGSGRLEQADQPTGPWTAVPDAVSGWNLNATDAGRFFRVRWMFPLEITIEGQGAGRVVSQPAGLDCGDVCQAWFDSDTTVTLTPEPDDGSRFAGWDGAASGAEPAQVVMDQAQAVSARFEPDAPPVGLVNPDFEEGPGVGWVQIPGPLIVPASTMGVSAWSGQYVARLGYEADNRDEVIIGQVLTLPATSPLYLHFSLWIYSEEICDVPWYDYIAVYVNGVVLDENSRVCSSANTDGWVRAVEDLSPYAGQQIELAFLISSVDALASIVLLDGLEINNSP